MRVAQHPDYAQAKAFVWVEDELTATLLEEVWDDVDFHIGIAHGSVGVRALVEERDRPPHVVGYIDRDFALSNRTKWRDARVLQSERHEMENYLLDYDALAAVGSSRATIAAAVLESDARNFAHELTWWMAAKATLDELRISLSKDFPADPTKPPNGLDAKDEASAIAYVCASPYWAALAARTTATLAAAPIELRMRGKHAKFAADVVSGAWETTFSGKEILRRLRNAHPSLERTRGTSAERDEALARDIATHWRTTSSAHATHVELGDLRNELRARFGLPP